MLINFFVQNFKVINSGIRLSLEASKQDELEEYYVIKVPFGSGLEVNLLKLILIYGPNASGKTTILQALNFLASLVLSPLPDKSKEFRYLRPFLGNKQSRTANTVFEIEFISNRERYIYYIELNKKAIIREVLYRKRQKKSLVYERKTDMDKQLAHIKFGPSVKISSDKKAVLESNTLWNNPVLGGYLKSNLHLQDLDNVINWFKYSLIPVIFPERFVGFFLGPAPDLLQKIEKKALNKKRVIHLLKKADFGIKDFRLEKKRLPETAIELLKKIAHAISETGEEIPEQEETFFFTELFFTHFADADFSLPAVEESAGTMRFFRLCALLEEMAARSIVIPLDELEASLHPVLIKYFLIMLLKTVKNSQLIATTQYRELLREKEILRRDAIWFTDKKEDGSADLFSLADFRTSELRREHSIYNAYKIGKLGAVPDVKDFEPLFDTDEE